MQRHALHVSSVRILLLSLMLGVPFSILNAQEEYSPDSWDFHVLAAFNSQPEDRKAINHLGLVTETLDNEHYVAAVLEGYPAHEAGLRRGDKLLRVNGAAFHPVFSLNEDSAQGFAARSTESITLEYSRGANSYELVLETRYENLFDAYRNATANSVQQFHAGNKIVGYVHLWALSRASNDLHFFLSVMRACGGCDGMIIDLRHGYGFLDVGHLDALFANRTRYARLQVSNAATREAYRALIDPKPAATGRNSNFDKPIAVLQNGDSWGQIELLLHQLNALSRSTSIGETSAGKPGRVERIRNDDNPDAFPRLIYRDAADLLADGKRLEGQGIAPDIRVDYPLNKTLAADPQYEAAVLALLEIM